MSIQRYIDAANTIYGAGTGELIYGFADDFCRNAFDGAITADMTILLTTAMSPYNRFAGWYCSHSDTIEIMRYHCTKDETGIIPKDPRDLQLTLAHELCHKYQFKALGDAGNHSRGPHRCKSWYDAITKATPYMCGVDIEGLCKPLTSKRINGSVRKVQNPESLTEPELGHWPQSIFELIGNDDPRLEGRYVGEVTTCYQ